MTDWNELADRWTRRCPKCGERVNYRLEAWDGVCDNEDCEDGRANAWPPPTETENA